MGHTGLLSTGTEKYALESRVIIIYDVFEELEQISVQERDDALFIDSFQTDSSRHSKVIDRTKTFEFSDDLHFSDILIRHSHRKVKGQSGRLCGDQLAHWLFLPNSACLTEIAGIDVENIVRA